MKPKTESRKQKAEILPAPAPKPVYIISNEAVAEMEAILNSSIHELVFAFQFLGDDNTDDAQNALTTVGMNVDRVQEMIVAIEKEIAAKQQEAS